MCKVKTVETMISFETVDTVFHQADGGDLVVLKEFSLDIRKGEVVSFVGPSGCGKTTLLKLIGALESPTRGRVSVGGKTPEEARRKRYFSFVFQNPVLLPWRTVRSNVELAGEVLNDPAARSRAD